MSGYLGIGWDGWDQTWSEYYDGVIDSVAVWDKTLSSAEVAALYDTADKSGYHLTTKEYDTDIGLYYFFNRWYDPTVGRFTTRSPLPAYAEHPYTYCRNNPANAVDPLGLSGNDWGKCFDSCMHVCSPLLGPELCYIGCALVCALPPLPMPPLFPPPTPTPRPGWETPIPSPEPPYRPPTGRGDTTCDGQEGIPIPTPRHTPTR
jgi:RHS repeat-associated protein